MQMAIYLLLGVGLMGGLFWVLTQVTARQRQLNAELTRLERLAAEVAMSAEALLERVDERTEKLQALMAEVTAAAEAARQAAASVPAPAREAAAEPTEKPKAKRRKRAAENPAEETAAEEPASPAARYRLMRSTAWALADQGKDVGAIAHELGIPRGEADLLLNLRGRKVTA